MSQFVLNTSDFNMPNDHFGNPGMQFAKNSLAKANAVNMVFFSPQRQTPQVIRPQIYNFNGEVIQYASEVVDKRRLNMNIYQDLYGNGNPSICKAIVPSTEAIGFNSQNFEDKWSFMLIVDQLNTMGSSLPSRTFYIGYCMDEPFVTNFGQTVYNENCVLVILHTTASHLSERFTSNGMANILNVVQDIDFVPGHAVLFNTNHSDLYLSTPGNIAKAAPSIAVGGGTMYPDEIIFSPESISLHNRDISNEEKNAAVTTDYRSSIHHMHSLLNNVITAKNEQELESVSQFSIGYNMGSLGEVFSNMVQSNDIINSRTSIGLDASRAYTLGEIQRIYNNDITFTSFSVNPGERDIVNPYMPTRENLISSIISDTLTPMAANLGLVNVSFSFNSTIRSDNGEKGAFEAYDVGFAMGISQDMQHRILRTFFNDVRRILLPVVITHCQSEFSLNAMIVSCGENFIQINLLDSSTPNNGLYSVNNMFGGMISPLIADYKTVKTNATNISFLISGLDVDGGANAPSFESMFSA